MKKPIFIIIVSVFVFNFVFSQQDTIIGTNKNNKYIIGLIPSKANNIFGLAVGPLGSEVICNKPYTQFSYGLNLQIPGQGFMQTFYINQQLFKKIYKTNKSEDVLIHNDTANKRVVHNGLIISAFGTFTDQINGISVSAWMSLGKKMNGVSINLLWNLYTRMNGVSIGMTNYSVDTKGVQIGLINKTVKLKGIQIGLWNKNEKNTLPIINWNLGKNKKASEN